MMHISCFDQIG